GAIVGKNVYDTVATVKSTYVKLSLPAPRWNDPDYLPFDVLVQYLNLDEISPLKQALLSGDKPMATEVDISLSTYAEFSRLDISVLTNDPARRGDILSTVLTTLQGMADYQADNEALDGIKTSVWTQAIYNADKLHYYGFLIAPMIFTAGWDFIQSYPDKLKAVAWQECRRAAEKWLGDPPYVATMIRPAQETDKTPFVPAGLTAEEVKAYFDTASIPQHELTAAVNLTFPEVDTVSFNLSSNATYHREVLPNGLTVLVKTSPSSRVFAVDILGKDRSANEPDSLIGITDFVNRCLEKGTLSRDAAALSRDLAKIGANLTLYDNPWIPYDDRYTTPQYSFIKFETIDEFASRGLGLLYDLVCYPAFDSAAVEQVRTQMLGIIARASGSPTKTARRLFYRTLFGAGAYARPVTGTKETISAIGIPDLRAYHRRFYAPNNMILSIVGNQPVEQIMDWVRATFGRLAPVKAEYRQGTPPQAVLAEKKVHVDMPSSQIGIYLGGALPGIHSEDATALSVAGAVLSAQLYGNLREKQGLAYSIGAGTAFDRDFGWWVCSMGTATGNYKKALTGLTLEIDKLRFDGPTPGDVRVARNHIWGRLMSAKLSRINQAYYMARDEFLGRPIDADPEFLTELQQVDAAAVRRVAATWFRTDAP
ncbi:MAG: insulinase family protein, partial [Candidatus Zixiibacteriota bacterium]